MPVERISRVVKPVPTLAPILAVLLAALPSLAHEQSKAATDHTWQTGTVQAFQVKHAGHFDPLSLQINLDVLSQRVLYHVRIAPGIHMKDLIPVTGNIQSEKRRSQMRKIQIPVGSQVKIALEGYHGWLLDPEGTEREILIRGSEVVKP